MSRKKSHDPPGYGRLLDAWTPPDDAGDPIGCVATTFTFHPALFEEECLGRFLQMETDAAEQSAAYLIEREERLRQLKCAAVLVDSHFARGLRSLRWDLLVARVKPGILHAKISLLLWANRARLIVSSANLTTDGYRRNREVFGVLDYFAGSAAPLLVLRNVTGYLDECASRLVNPEDAPVSAALDRWTRFLADVRQRTTAWGNSSVPRGWSQTRVYPILVRPGGSTSVFKQIADAWPLGRPTDVFVVSPFFDPPEAPNCPAKETGKLFGPKIPASIEYQLQAEDVESDTPGEPRVKVKAPGSLRDARPAHANCEVKFTRLPEDDGRPLHAKCLWLENAALYGYLIGSSNFTSAGLGLSPNGNWEANLLYVAHQERNPSASKSLSRAWLGSEEFTVPIEALEWSSTPDDGEDAAPTGVEVLPSAFNDATFAHTEAGPYLRLTITGQPPAGWRVDSEENATLIADEAAWRSAGGSVLEIPWHRPRPPAQLRVQWTNGDGPAWWPVNVETADSLPPPDELRDLSLEVLVEILTSAQPLHQVIGRLRTRAEKQRFVAADLDPHRRIDVSAFLLQRTRRISQALRALRERLERPIVSEAVLNWRLFGPVGAMAVAQAVAREARSDAERGFLLTELCLELRRVRYQSLPESLAAKTVYAAIRELISRILDQLPGPEAKLDEVLRRYTENAFAEVSS